MVLTKHRTVLHLLESVATNALVSFGQEPIEGDRTVWVMFDRADWIDMGQPQQITVSIEPGDLLNAEG
jgi:hypothetical protein